MNKELQIIYAGLTSTIIIDAFPGSEDVPDILQADDFYISSDEGFKWRFNNAVKGRFSYWPNNFEWLIKDGWLPSEFRYCGTEAFEFVAYINHQLANAMCQRLKEKTIKFDDLKRTMPKIFEESVIQKALTEFYLNDGLITKSEFGKESAKKRWERPNDEVEKLVTAAKDRWKIGCPFDHIKMTNDLLIAWKREHPRPSFSIAMVQKKIKIAAPPDKIRGLADVKLDNTPSARICKTCKLPSAGICIQF